MAVAPCAHRGRALDDVVKAAFAALQLVDREMSTYKADSTLMQLNDAPIGEWIEVSQDMHTVMSYANDVARHTDGALNIVLGKMVNTWGFGPVAPPDIIPDVAIQRSQAALAAIGSFAVRQNPPSVRKDGDIAFDLSALAKGFAVDQAANAVRALGIDSFLIEAAGEIYAEGFRPDGSSWHVGLELPVRDD